MYIKPFGCTGYLWFEMLVTTLIISICTSWFLQAHARSAVTPWTSQQTYQNLVYGATTPADLPNIIGAMPDEIERAPQMSPVIEYYFYYADGGSGEASIFVFQNNLLAGLLYKSADNQYTNLTYFLPSNGDMTINNQIMGNMMPFYTNFPLYSLYNW